MALKYKEIPLYEDYDYKQQLSTEFDTFTIRMRKNQFTNTYFISVINSSNLFIIANKEIIPNRVLYFNWLATEIGLNGYITLTQSKKVIGSNKFSDNNTMFFIYRTDD